MDDERAGIKWGRDLGIPIAASVAAQLLLLVITGVFGKLRTLPFLGALHILLILIALTLMLSMVVGGAALLLNRRMDPINRFIGGPMGLAMVVPLVWVAAIYADLLAWLWS